MEKDAKGYPMKAASEIQHAHDVLHGIATGEVRLPDMSRAERDACHVAHDVLCWVLGHPAGKTFAENVERVVEEAMKAGYHLRSGLDQN